LFFKFDAANLHYPGSTGKRISVNDGLMPVSSVIEQKNIDPVLKMETLTLFYLPNPVIEFAV
jgi:hypothetical protein